METQASQLNQRQEQIIQTVYDYFGTDIAERGNPSRKRIYVIPRQVSMYFLRNEMVTPKKHAFKLKNIGKTFGRDHSSMCYAKGVVSDIMDTDKFFRAKVNEIETLINN